MKKITILLVIIFTFLFSTTSWGEWNLGSESIRGNKYYYDKDRVRKSGKFIYFWELTDYLKPSEMGDLSIIKYSQLDCSIFRYKVLVFQTYKNSMGEGEKTLDYNPPGEWDYPRPNTSTEIMYKKICEEHQ